MKVLAIGDPHFKVDNTEESEHFHLQVELYLSQNAIDVVVILGDILHSHEKIYTFAMNTAVKFIRMCSRFAPTYCLVGNHDATSNTIYCSENHWLHVLLDQPNVFIVDKPTWIHFDAQTSLKLLCCPYVSDGRFKEMLDQFVGKKDQRDIDEDEEWRSADCIFAHQLLDGGKMGAVVASGVEKWLEKYPQVISGHLHDRQQPQPNLYYAGSSQQLAFSENGDKSIALVSFLSNENTEDETIIECKIEEIFLQLKQRKTISCNCANATSIKIQPNIQYKIVIKDVDAAIKAFKKTAKYKELQAHSQIRSVQFKRLTEEEKEDDTSNKTGANDFLFHLHAKLQGENLYLQSYANSLLTGSEDFSDKDIVLM